MTNKPIVRIDFDEIDSTNQYLLDIASRYVNDIVVVTTQYQSKGRGQGGNGWQSEHHQNLLFSILVHPTQVPVSRQFLLSMAGALALKKVLDGYVSNISLKWPNDIYWCDKKLSGTLIETKVNCGTLQHCVFGVGLNVNQRQFVSDAPNPVSLCQILGNNIDREKLLIQLIDAFICEVDSLIQGNYQDTIRQYHEALYRKNGEHWFRDKTGLIKASIAHITPEGLLVLKNTHNLLRSYAFKEIEFVL